jgi:hypothetical protein
VTQPLKIAHYDDPGLTLSVSVVRVSDLYAYDFSDSTFRSSPTDPTDTMTASTGIAAGEYLYNFSDTPAPQWTTSDYRVRIHDATGIRAAMLVHCWEGDFSTPVVGFDPRVRIVP